MRGFITKAANALYKLTIKIAQALYRIIVELVKGLYWIVFKIIQGSCWLVPRIAAIVYENFNRRHRSKLGKKENILRFFISIFILYIFSKALLETDWRLGASFIFAGATAVWFGYIYRGRDVMGLVLVGVILGSLVSALAPDAWKALSSGDFIGAVIVIGIMGYLYFASREFKRGRRPR